MSLDHIKILYAIYKGLYLEGVSIKVEHIDRTDDIIYSFVADDNNLTIYFNQNIRSSNQNLDIFSLNYISGKINLK